ncbi:MULTISPECIES: helix-turn-helix domain-containing protein [unclassified Rhizobium]|uniref:helix-turn-helix domain-containing protein n=1 Tax=unclassified Rhizobium TaxID=2613769 RepID=UPI001ADCA4C9|nr:MULTISPECIES: helix-turn-helix transcriptional regulator [unclassified Rhizobium]MBO9099980.1 helix-turn-helix transcriptional regulator [Rhizobium sp. L58/93]QXZ82791.1 helix-turn-helix transcriptional regulator [Rhizobium sp. K1/93]QXZ89696.1 helix-turn-helix transcriptional regulator [Rhizobium sp. K15/93]
MKLAQYMSDNSIAPEGFAEIVGSVSASGVRKWMYGERTPRVEQLRKIAEVTNGAVCPNDFILISEAVE